MEHDTGFYLRLNVKKQDKNMKKKRKGEVVAENGERLGGKANGEL